MTPTSKLSSSSDGGNRANLDHALRYAVQPGETVIWAERPNAFLLPKTTPGIFIWLPVVLLPVVGGFVLAYSVGSALEASQTVLGIAFAIVWTAIAVSAAYFTITRPRHTINVLTDRRFFSIDSRIPFLADSYWKSANSSSPLRSVSLRGAIASPVLVLRTDLVSNQKVVEFAGLSDARGTAELICKTLDCPNFEDLTQ